jgi:hypothetical protein
LPKLADTHDVLRPRLAPAQSGQEQAHADADNSDNYEQLYEGERGV